ncbi:MAG: transglycosylase SLT domain-containing protein [Candidatus Cloacimonetes bacterium]|jgi:soluble lytic murein transglycosylase|nr:transglycosylase SLT domain-containing protein [Candidatus Cloacimonadota bacterium]MDY0172493.1 transglycosylase SLT domain-containing protein [Candidatus Cloacimonadaceae bacterium]
MARNKKRDFIVLTVTILLLAVILTYNPVSVRITTVAVAVYYQIDPGLFYRLIRTESNFRSFAISHKQAIGLGQMQENTAHYMNQDHKRGLLFVPQYNLRISAIYLKYLHKKYNGNWSLTLAAYNWGETNVSRRMRSQQIEPKTNYQERFRDIPETYNYIGKILPATKKA